MEMAHTHLRKKKKKTERVLEVKATQGQATGFMSPAQGKIFEKGLKVKKCQECHIKVINLGSSLKPAPDAKLNLLNSSPPVLSAMSTVLRDTSYSQRHAHIHTGANTHACYRPATDTAC